MTRPRLSLFCVGVVGFWRAFSFQKYHSSAPCSRSNAPKGLCVLSWVEILDSRDVNLRGNLNPRRPTERPRRRSRHHRLRIMEQVALKSSQRVQSQRVLRRLEPQAMRLAPRSTSGQISRSSSALPVWMHEAGRVESTQCARRWNGSALCTSRYSSPSPSPVPSQALGEERGWSWTHPSFQRILL